MKRSVICGVFLTLAVSLGERELLGTVRTVPIISGLSSPIAVTSPPGDTERLFVVEQIGRIRVLRNGIVDSTLLNLSTRVSCCGERGLLGLAFHPRFLDNGKFYVNYTDATGATVISEFRIGNEDPDVADISTERVLLRQFQPYANHNGGHMEFSPFDGYLYIGFGDGGGAGDPQNNAQSELTWLGKMLRIDVDGRDGGKFYAVPPDNPFFARGGKLAEVWATGLRNPWGFGFDPWTGDLFLPDVGQDSVEEVNLQPGTSRGGENYGWRLMEGSNCYNPSQECANGRTLTLPVHEYRHTDGRCSVIGGAVVRNAEVPELDGSFVFSDYCTGELFALSRISGGRIEVKNFGREISYGGGKRFRNPAGIGTDSAGRLYLCDVYDGTIFRIESDNKSIPRTVPIVLDASGRGGARYKSAMSVVNTGSTPVSLTYTYSAAAQLGASGSGSASENLPAGTQLSIPDVLERLRTLGVPIPREGNQGGILQIASVGGTSGGAVKVTARTTAPSGPGVSGLAYGAPLNSQMFKTGALVFGLRENEAERSNLALYNPSGVVVTVDVTIISGDTGVRKPLPEPVILQPGEWRQLEGLLPWAGFSHGTASLRQVGGTGYFSAYGVANDSTTFDGSFLKPVRTEMPKEPVVVPVVLETNAYDTEVILANPSDDPVVATLQYRESLGGYTGDVVTLEERLEPRRQVLLKSFLDKLRASGGAVGAKGTNLAGSLTVSFRNSDGFRVSGLAGALIRTIAAAGSGRYGVFLQGVTQSEAFYGTATVSGLLQDGKSRSNVAVVHAGDTSSYLNLYLDVVNGETGAVAGTVGPIGLGMGEWKQVDGILKKFGLAQGYVRVRAEGTARFIAYGVINDGPEPGQGTSDGSAYLGE